jgi:hypothetical protein
MTTPELPQEPEGIAAGAIWLVGAGVIAICAALVGIAWLLVPVPPVTRRPATAASPLERTMIDRAAGGAALDAAAAARLEGSGWVDRRGRIARIPIELALEAVAADPSLIAAGSPAFGARPAARAPGSAAPAGAASDPRATGAAPSARVDRPAAGAAVRPARTIQSAEAGR